MFDLSDEKYCMVQPSHHKPSVGQLSCYLTSSGRAFNASKHTKKRVWPHKTSDYCTIPIAIPLKGYSNNIVIPFQNWSTCYETD